jgi:hypothetical protein
MNSHDQLKILELLVEVQIDADKFLTIVETLTRIGVSSARENNLYPSTHILHKGGRYWILHFKHLMQLDGLPTDITEQDLSRYFTICQLLEQWGLVSILDKSKINSIIDLKLIKIVPFKDKSKWKIIPKFTIAKK